jgi:L-alanine-DL-glutamate epimerase-like enolase superfamily enzyme
MIIGNIPVEIPFMGNDLKITQVKTWSENLELTRPYSISYRTINSIENVFVHIETGNGLSGIGSGSPAQFVTGETLEASKTILNDKLESLLLGKDIRLLNEQCRLLETAMPETPAARTAIDIALHDTLAKHLNIPLVDMFGRAHHSLPTSITIGIKDTIQETLEESEEYMAKGFKIIKLKIGKSVEKDVETTRKLFEKIGKRMKIRVDANQGYTPQDLIEYSQQTEGLNLDLIEQPFKRESVKEMYEVPEKLRNSCAADESLHGPSDALQLAAYPHAFGIYNIKLMKCGGVFQAKQIADIAQLSGIKLMWGCMDESIISITAALHAALASPATHYLDLDGSFDLARDIVRGGFILKDGCLSTTNEPGLGVQLIN